jgi:hypothetical protein
MELLDAALLNNLGPNEPTNRLMSRGESDLLHNYHNHHQLQELAVMVFQFFIKIPLSIPYFIHLLVFIFPHQS